MKIIFMGTPDFAVPTLKALISNEYEIGGVVTQPDKPKGRGKRLTPSPIKKLSNENDLKVYQPQNVNSKEFVDLLQQISPDLIVVVAFGQILTKDVLNIPKFGCINVHASLLPKYRGAAPIQWSIINGEEVTGVTTMYMEEGMDTGDIILQEQISIKKNETADILHDRLSSLGAEVLIKTIELIEKEQNISKEQDHSKATYAPMLKKESGKIDWNMNALDIKNLIRGTYPWPGAYTYYEGKKVKIFNVDVEESNFKVKPGTIVDVTKDSIIVQSGDGLVLIKEIQAENGKRMEVQNYLLGHTIEKNKVLCGDGYGTSI